MSHTTTIGQILFADADALRAAAEELKARGIDCDLIESATPRAYFNDQMGEAPLVLKLNKSRFDVGFYEEEDKDGLVAKCDLWGNDIAGQIGTPQEEGVTPTEAALGQLRNTYATHAVMNRAMQQGHSVQRIDEEDGSVQLVIDYAA